MSHTLILLRHGQSEWNEKNLFTGWYDVSLTEKGRAEEQHGGRLRNFRNVAVVSLVEALSDGSR